METVKVATADVAAANPWTLVSLWRKEGKATATSSHDNGTPVLVCSTHATADAAADVTALTKGGDRPNVLITINNNEKGRRHNAATPTKESVGIITHKARGVGTAANAATRVIQKP